MTTEPHGEQVYMTIPVTEFEMLHTRASHYLAQRDFLWTALERVKAEGGKVCAEFEFCQHVACMSSYAAWSIADAALKGETPESANAKAIAERRRETGDL
jgi:hypothetical protein